MVFSMLNGN